ncbi:hypothetical protein [Nocardia fluminea]|uniref:hypothetical protein n=1 Tax=Nocardia fluminea TaxID=134984 RepID=UPI0011814D3F|nr:hypothetical protein [Nocardia fluminea]
MLTRNGTLPSALALRRTLIRAVVGWSGLTLRGPEPWLFGGATGNRRSSVVRAGAVAGLFGTHSRPGAGCRRTLTGMPWCAGQIHRGPIGRLTKPTGLFERRITGAHRRSSVARSVVRSVTRPAGTSIHGRHGFVAVGVLSGRHPTFPRSTGRPAQGRVVVVVTPMSGIIVAHHASCTRRNPRIPPVR